MVICRPSYVQQNSLSVHQSLLDKAKTLHVSTVIAVTEGIGSISVILQRFSNVALLEVGIEVEVAIGVAFPIRPLAHYGCPR